MTAERSTFFLRYVSVKEKKSPNGQFCVIPYILSLKRVLITEKKWFLGRKKSARPNLGARIFRTKNGVLPVFGIKKWLFLAQNSGASPYIYIYTYMYKGIYISTLFLHSMDRAKS